MRALLTAQIQSRINSRFRQNEEDGLAQEHHKQIDIDARLIRLYITAADYREQAYDYKFRRSVRHRYEQRAERCAFDIAFKEELCKHGIDNKAEQNVDDR